MGSIGKGPYGNIIDVYTLSANGISGREVHMDMHHRGYYEKTPIPGFYIFNIDLVKLNPPSGNGGISELTAFAGRLGDAADNESASLQALLAGRHTADQCRMMLVAAVSLVLMSYGENREKVVQALLRREELGLSDSDANLVFTFVVGE